MKKGVIWILLTCLMATSVVLASCSISTPTETQIQSTTPTATVTPNQTTTISTTVPVTTLATTTTATGNWWDSLGVPAVRRYNDHSIQHGHYGF